MRAIPPPVPPDLGDQEVARQDEFLSVKRKGERDPATGVPSVDSSPDQGTASTHDVTALPELSEWQNRANEVAAWLPHATREALMAFAWRHFQRAESAACCIAEEHRRADCAAQRQASWAIADALDWSAEHPTFAELERRRGVVA